MKKTFLVCLILCGFVIARAQINFQWAKQIGGTANDFAYSTVVDPLGNVYSTGYFYGVVDFDPGPGTFTLSSFGNEDIFVSKLDPAGNFVWAKSMGGTGYDEGYSIALDGSGNVLITGYYDATVDFDPGSGIFNLTSAGSFDVFVSKLNSSGNFIWAKSFGNSGIDVGFSIVADASGNIITTGSFMGTTDFDPNGGTYNLVSAGVNDVFINKLDGLGNFVWAKKFGGVSDEFGLDIAVDGLGNIYTTGYFSDTCDFDPGAGVFDLTAVFIDVFISKLSSSGSFVWVKGMGNSGTQDSGNSIAVDATGNVYTTGYFGSTVDFDPGPGTFNITASSFSDSFVSKLSSSGNFIWAKNFGGNGGNLSNSICLDAGGDVYTTGSFQNTVDFDPGTGIYNLTSAGNSDIFISKLNTNGVFINALQLGGTTNEIGNSIAVDGSGSIHTVGYFTGTCDFDPGTSVYSLSVTGSSFDIFISKLSQPAFGIEDFTNEQGLFLSPNPNAGDFNIEVKNSIEEGEMIIFNSLNQEVYRQKIIQGSNNIKMTELKSALYYFIIQRENEKPLTGKVIIE